MLIDTGNLSDILIIEVFGQLGIARDRLRLVATPLVRFHGPVTKPLGMMELQVLMGTHPQQTLTLVNYMVVEAPLIYNVILGRPTLSRTKSVVSTYSLVVKFPTPHEARAMWGDQATTRYY